MCYCWLSALYLSILHIHHIHNTLLPQLWKLDKIERRRELSQAYGSKDTTDVSRLRAFQSLLDASWDATEPRVEMTALRKLCGKGRSSRSMWYEHHYIEQVLTE